MPLFDLEARPAPSRIISWKCYLPEHIPRDREAGQLQMVKSVLQ
jgi:hypothetical protein